MAQAGTVWIDVRADPKAFLREMQAAGRKGGQQAAEGARQARRDMDRAGEALGEAAGEGIGSGVDSSLSGLGGDLHRSLMAEASGLDDTGQRIGRDFGEGVEAGVDSSTSAIGAGVEQDLRVGAGDLGTTGRRVGQEFGEGVDSGIDASTAGLGAELDSELRAATSGLGPIGRNAGDDFGQGIEDGLGDADPGGAIDDMLGDLGGRAGGAILAAGAAAGALWAGAFADAIESERGIDFLAARLDVGTRQAEQFGRVSGELWADGFGQSRDDVNAAIDAVFSTFEDGRDSEEALERLTTKALTLADVMGTDVAEAVTNAGILIETGLARDADHAFDLIVAGAQRVPAGVRDELQEATHEYSQFFAGLGFTGEEAFGVLVEAADGGRYAIDKAGDAIKEFRIRATDMSDLTVTAYETMGLSAQQMTEDLLAGGERAKGAYDQIISALLAIEDPATRANTAIALFGTPLEDIAGDGAKLDQTLRDLASGGMADVAGSADETAAAFDNTASSIQVLRREVEKSLSDAAADFLDPLVALREVDEEGWGNVGSEIGGWLWRGVQATPFGAGLSGAVEVQKDIWHAIFGDPEEEGEQRGRAAGAALGAAARDSAAAEDPAEIGYVFGIEMPEGQPDEFIEDADALEARVKAFAEHIDNLAIPALQHLAEEFDINSAGAEAFGQYLDLSSPLDDLVGSAVDAGDALDEMRGVLDDLPDSLNVAEIAWGDLTDEQSKAVETFMSGGQAIRDYLGTLIETGSTADEVRAAAARYREELAEQMRQAGFSEHAIAQYQETLGLTERQIDTAITISGDAEAITKLQLLQASMGDEALPREIELNVRALIAEDNFQGAAALMSGFIQDQQNGLLENPLLIAMLADLTPAELAIIGFTEGVADQPPVAIPTTADTSQADEVMATWRNDVTGETVVAPLGANDVGAQAVLIEYRNKVTGETLISPMGSDPGAAYEQLGWFTGTVTGTTRNMPIGADLTKADEAVRNWRPPPKIVIIQPSFPGGDPGSSDPFRNGPAAAAPRRARGGPVWEDEAFLVGEEGPELGIFPRNGGMVDAQTTERLLSDAMAPEPILAGPLAAPSMTLDPLLSEMQAMRADLGELRELRNAFGDVAAAVRDARPIEMHSNTRDPFETAESFARQLRREARRG